MKIQKNLLEQEKHKLNEILYEKDELTRQINIMVGKLSLQKRELSDGDDGLRQLKKVKDSSDVVEKGESSSQPNSHIKVISKCKFLNGQIL